MGDEIIQSVAEEKDLGVTIHQSLNTSVHCANAIKRANQALGLIKKTVVFKSRVVILHLYKALVRPHLEYYISKHGDHISKEI